MASSVNSSSAPRAGHLITQDHFFSGKVVINGPVNFADDGLECVVRLDCNNANISYLKEVFSHEVARTQPHSPDASLDALPGSHSPDALFEKSFPSSSLVQSLINSVAVCSSKPEDVHIHTFVMDPDDLKEYENQDTSLHYQENAVGVFINDCIPKYKGIVLKSGRCYSQEDCLGKPKSSTYHMEFYLKLRSRNFITNDLVVGYTMPDVLKMFNPSLARNILANVHEKIVGANKPLPRHLRILPWIFNKTLEPKRQVRKLEKSLSSPFHRFKRSDFLHIDTCRFKYTDLAFSRHLYRQMDVDTALFERKTVSFMVSAYPSVQTSKRLKDIFHCKTSQRWRYPKGKETIKLYQMEGKDRRRFRLCELCVATGSGAGSEPYNSSVGFCDCSKSCWVRFSTVPGAKKMSTLLSERSSKHSEIKGLSDALHCNIFVKLPSGWDQGVAQLLYNKLRLFFSDDMCFHFICNVKDKVDSLCGSQALTRSQDFSLFFSSLLKSRKPENALANQVIFGNELSFNRTFEMPGSGEFSQEDFLPVEVESKTYDLSTPSGVMMFNLLKDCFPFSVDFAKTYRVNDDGVENVLTADVCKDVHGRKLQINHHEVCQKDGSVKHLMKYYYRIDQSKVDDKPEMKGDEFYFPKLLLRTLIDNEVLVCFERMVQKYKKSEDFLRGEGTEVSLIYRPEPTVEKKDGEKKDEEKADYGNLLPDRNNVKVSLRYDGLRSPPRLFDVALSTLREHGLGEVVDVLTGYTQIVIE